VLDGTAELDQEAASAYSRRFSPADIAADYLATYRTLLASGSDAGHALEPMSTAAPARMGL
jgi:hypothetical protein